MRKLLLLLFLLLPFNLFSQFQSDIIVTSPNGIWTDSRAYATLNAAITAIGANERTVVIPSPQTITTLTVPSNITLEFRRNGSIVNSGQLTINTVNIVADNRQIFAGIGNIDFASGSVIKSGWFANFESAIALTVNDSVTLIVSKQYTLTSSFPVGNNVQLKWESPQNRLTANAGVTISNIGQVEAGDYQIFAGGGTFTFLDGDNLNLKWFLNLRTAITWISTTRATIIIPGTNLVDYSDTIPSNINLDFNSRQGILSISAGITLTVNAPIISSPRQIFSGTGTVTTTVAHSENIFPEWWGANGNDAIDDNSEIQSAIDFAAFNGSMALSSVHLGPGTFRFTNLELYQAQQFSGSWLGETRLFRVGGTGIALGMKSGQVASRLGISNLHIDCNNIGVSLNCIELGTETPGTTDFALGSRLTNIKINNASGTGLRIHANVGYLNNVWVQDSGDVNINVSGGVIIASFLSSEGAVNEDLILSAIGSHIDALQLEATNNTVKNDTIDAVSIRERGISIDFTWANYAGLPAGTVRRSVVGIIAGQHDIKLGPIFNGGGTYTEFIHDISNGTDMAVPPLNKGLPGYSSNGSGEERQTFIDLETLGTMHFGADLAIHGDYINFNGATDTTKPRIWNVLNDLFINHNGSLYIRKNNSNELVIDANGITVTGYGVFSNYIQFGTVTFASLPTATAGRLVRCSDCSVATPCTGGGAGAWAFANGAQWKCAF